MTNFDIITIIVLLIFTTISFFKGGIGSILSLAKWYGAGILSVMFYPQAKEIAEGSLGKSIISSGVAIFAIYIIALLVLYLITKVILMGLSGIVGGVGDRFAGLIIGFTIGLIIISSAHFAIRSTADNKDPDWLKSGKTYELTKFGADNLKQAFNGDISGMLEDFGVAMKPKKPENEISENELKGAEDLSKQLSDEKVLPNDLNVEKIRKALEELKAEGLSKDEAKKELEKMIEKNTEDFRSFDEEVKAKDLDPSE